MVIAQFYPIVGGAERQAQKLAKKLIQRGFDVSVVTGRYPGLKKSEIIDGIPVFRTRIFGIKRGNRIKFGGYILLFSMFWYLIKNRKKYDIIHIHQGLHPAFIGVLASRLLGKKSLIKIGNSGERFDFKLLSQKPIFGPMMAKYILNADKIIAISSQIEQELLNFGFRLEQIIKIPNGVEEPSTYDKIQLSTLRKKLGIPQDACMVVFVGSLSPKKNIRKLIEAWGLVVAQSNKKIKLILLGEGEQRREIERLVNSKSLDEYVELKGKVNNVGEYLTVSDVFVLPSLVEGLSNALLEAMAYGVACAASSIPGNIDIIKHEQNGLLFSPEDETEIASQLLRLIGDSSLRERLGSKAVETIERKYTLDRVTEKYCELYIQ